MAENDRPRFDTCEDTVGPRLHGLASAWGHTWCECRHAFLVEQHDPAHDGIDADNLPAWWEPALREALPKFPDFDLATAWVSLRELSNDLAADATYERWDEFARHTLNMGEEEGEQFLRLLDAAGIADVVPSAWDYSDGKNYWHSGEKCGCTLLHVSLNAEALSEARS